MLCPQSCHSRPRSRRESHYPASSHAPRVPREGPEVSRSAASPWQTRGSSLLSRKAVAQSNSRTCPKIPENGPCGLRVGTLRESLEDFPLQGRVFSRLLHEAVAGSSQALPDVQNTGPVRPWASRKTQNLFARLRKCRGSSWQSRDGPRSPWY